VAGVPSGTLSAFPPVTSETEVTTHPTDAAGNGRVRIAAAVLFLSGAIIGCTLGRLSTWLPSMQGGSLASSAVRPPATTASRVSAAISAPERPATPASVERNPEAPPPLVASNDRKPEVPALREEAVPPSITLLNPGAAEREAAKEAPPATAPQNGASDDTPHRRRDRRAASVDENEQARARAPSTRRDYRGLREEMLGR
jgi:hypothetical protein